MTLNNFDAQQALWMFNENMNWRLDFLGRFVLSQKKKVRMNKKLQVITAQYRDVNATLQNTLYNWAEAQKEAETSAANSEAVTNSINQMLENWEAYQV